MNMPANAGFKLTPAVYQLKISKEGQHTLESNTLMFDTPPKVFGNTMKNVELFWKSFLKGMGSMGVMFTGSPGTGKTSMAELLSNMAIRHGMAVVMVVNIRPTVDTISFIGMLKNVVILFDEYGKVFNPSLQDKMLTMLSGADSGKKLFILTENDKYRISQFIRNRPGRVRYHLDFERVGMDVVDEYCSYMGVAKSMYDAIIAKYNTVVTFSFDHLQGIVTEHLDYPEDSFEVLLERLNLEILSKEEPLGVIGITLVSDKTKIVQLVSIDNAPTRSDFVKNGYIRIEVKPIVAEGTKQSFNRSDYIVLRGNDINSITDTTLEVNSRDGIYSVTLSPGADSNRYIMETTPKPKEGESTPITPMLQPPSFG